MTAGIITERSKFLWILQRQKNFNIFALSNWNNLQLKWYLIFFFDPVTALWSENFCLANLWTTHELAVKNFIFSSAISSQNDLAVLEFLSGIWYAKSYSIFNYYNLDYGVQKPMIEIWTLFDIMFKAIIFIEKQSKTAGLNLKMIWK